MKRKRSHGERKSDKKIEYLVADPPYPSTFLKEMGYVYLRKKIPTGMCADIKPFIESDVLELMKNTGMQEQPRELLSVETAQKMHSLEVYVLEKILRPMFNMHSRVPPHWSETVYGRVKKMHAYTVPQCDALNTVLERRLLSSVKDLRGFSNEIDWDAEDPIHTVLTSMPCAPIEECIPIYTVWIPLHDLNSIESSHLRIEPLSHLHYDIQVKRNKRTNKPTKIRSCSAKPYFLSPETPYSAGDVVIFHCLTQHDATSQKIKHEKSTTNARYRVSFDMRVLMDRTTGKNDATQHGRCVFI